MALNQAKVMKDLEGVVSGDKEDFIWGFLKAYEIHHVTITRLRSGDSQRNVAKIDGDIAISQKIYFRAVENGVSLEETVKQIQNLPVFESEKIRFILVTDYSSIYAYDKKVKDSTEFDYAELPINYEFFLPLTGKREKAIVYAEHPADIKACEKMGRLYDSIRAINQYENNELHALNVFLTRLLFCFFAEDTKIFESRQMTNALASNTLEDGSDTADFFERLFAVLDLPENSPERSAFSATFQAFPYVNGSLFSEKPAIPKFDKRTRKLLLECGKINWNDISPVIFGAMFQSVMDQDQRRNLGAHYTSEKNIFKVICPLFLDDLKEELEKILSMPKNSAKAKALSEYHKKLQSLGFLDPACGCGNFLIVAYRELRLLELRVLVALKEIHSYESLWFDVNLMQKVSIEQFYGIEIEEFPVDIAHVSLFLMEHVMNLKFAKVFGQTNPSIPLKHSATIVCTNALTTPWENIVPPEKINFIFGNPPFSGSSMLSKEQKDWVVTIFERTRLSSSLDYVCAWFLLASKYIQQTNISVCFVSTNSICQGEQVFPLWNKLFQLKIFINFAYQTFTWSNEAKYNAAVKCVIIGFSQIERKNKFIINNKQEKNKVSNISPYLFEGKTILVSSRANPLNARCKMCYGNKPTDNGEFILSEEEYNNYLLRYPSASFLLKRYVGASDFLNNNEKRFCLWLKNIDKSVWEQFDFICNRVEKVKKFRLKSSAKPTREKAELSHLFFFISQTNNDYLLIPRVSSERRKYIPIGFIKSDIIASDAVQIIPNATLYDFGILTSAMHMVWMRTVCGRLKSDYRYSASVVYNTFPFPNPTKQQKEQVSKLAEEILLIRETYPELTLAEMYDPDKMPEDLKMAHHTLDLAVDGLYRKKPFENDDERLQLLFSLYEKLTKENPETSKDNEEESEEE